MKTIEARPSPENTMNTKTELPFHALQPFVPDPEGLFPIDSVAHLAGMPRHLVLVCCRRGLVAPAIDPEYGGYLFDTVAIRTLQRIAYLHGECAINLTGIRIILQLMDEVERLRGRD
jgi:alkylation response protein AidB-like acyl-CoA dehydrogenase